MTLAGDWFVSNGCCIFSGVSTFDVFGIVSIEYLFDLNISFNICLPIPQQSRCFDIIYNSQLICLELLANILDNDVLL